MGFFPFSPVAAPPSGAAGGILGGTYPNPTFGAGAVAGGVLTGTYPNPAASASLMTPQASTLLAGVSLVNGTPTILTWTTPNDGLMHRVLIFGEVTTSVLEVGGAIQAQYTPPTGGAQTATLDAGAHAASVNGLSYFARDVAPNTAVSLVQSSALTAGAAILYAEIWGS